MVKPCRRLLILALLGAALLSGCGYKGDLRLPTDEERAQQDQATERTQR